MEQQQQPKLAEEMKKMEYEPTAAGRIVAGPLEHRYRCRFAFLSLLLEPVALPGRALMERIDTKNVRPRSASWPRPHGILRGAVPTTGSASTSSCHWASSFSVMASRPSAKALAASGYSIPNFLPPLFQLGPRFFHHLLVMVQFTGNARFRIRRCALFFPFMNDGGRNLLFRPAAPSRPSGPWPVHRLQPCPDRFCRTASQTLSARAVKLTPRAEIEGRARSGCRQGCCLFSTTQASSAAQNSSLQEPAASPRAWSHALAAGRLVPGWRRSGGWSGQSANVPGPSRSQPVHRS